MKIKMILLSLVTISILQGSELPVSIHNSLGIFYPGSCQPLITVIPWDNATSSEISIKTRMSFINEKQFPVGNFVYLVNETNNDFNVEVIEYNQELKKYNSPKIVDRELLDLNLQDCSYVVYNGGKGLKYDSLSVGAEFISKVHGNKVACVINYPTSEKSEILPLIKNKTYIIFHLGMTSKKRLPCMDLHLEF